MLIARYDDMVWGPFLASYGIFFPSFFYMVCPVL